MEKRPEALGGKKKGGKKKKERKKKKVRAMLARDCTLAGGRWLVAGSRACSHVISGSASPYTVKFSRNLER